MDFVIFGMLFSGLVLLCYAFIVDRNKGDSAKWIITHTDWDDWD